MDNKELWVIECNRASTGEYTKVAASKENLLTVFQEILDNLGAALDPEMDFLVIRPSEITYRG